MTPLAGKNNWWFNGNSLPIYLRSILKEFSAACVPGPRKPGSFCTPRSSVSGPQLYPLKRPQQDFSCSLQAMANSWTNCSVTNHAQRRFVNQYTRDGSSSGPVNFLSIDNAKRRVGGCADARNLDALRDARARDENEFVFCLSLRRILADNPTRVRGTSQQGRYAKTAR